MMNDVEHFFFGGGSGFGYDFGSCSQPGNTGYGSEKTF